MVRDVIATFVFKVAGVMNRKGIGRAKSHSTLSGVSTFSSTEGVFSRPKYSSYSYVFKDAVDISKMQDLMYGVLGSRITKLGGNNNSVLSDEKSFIKMRPQSTVKHGGPNQITITSLEERFRREWQNINNNYTKPLTQILTDDIGGIMAYSSLAPHQVIQPIGWSDNYVFGVSSLYANRGTDSRVVYLSHVNRSLLGLTNAYGDSQKYHDDAVELSDMVLASL